MSANSMNSMDVSMDTLSRASSVSSSIHVTNDTSTMMHPSETVPVPSNPGHMGLQRTIEHRSGGYFQRNVSHWFTGQLRPSSTASSATDSLPEGDNANTSNGPDTQVDDNDDSDSFASCVSVISTASSTTGSHLEDSDVNISRGSNTQAYDYSNASHWFAGSDCARPSAAPPADSQPGDGNANASNDTDHQVDYNDASLWFSGRTCPRHTAPAISASQTDDDVVHINRGPRRDIQYGYSDVSYGSTALFCRGPTASQTTMSRPVATTTIANVDASRGPDAQIDYNNASHWFAGRVGPSPINPANESHGSDAYSFVSDEQDILSVPNPHIRFEPDEKPAADYTYAALQYSHVATSASTFGVTASTHHWEVLLTSSTYDCYHAVPPLPHSRAPFNSPWGIPRHMPCETPYTSLLSLLERCDDYWGNVRGTLAQQRPDLVDELAIATRDGCVGGRCWLRTKKWVRVWVLRRRRVPVVGPCTTGRMLIA